jgi:uncharacterized membrane protein YsdA (DUF1294 family)
VTVLVLGLAIADRVPLWTPALYFGASVAAWLFYAWDKLQAERGGRRIPENALHALALAGGWPGALAAQAQFRHKTRKVSFRVVFWLTVIANVGLLVLAVLAGRIPMYR